MTTQTQTLSTFNFESHAIRTITISNEPWFIAKDVCEAVSISNYRDAIERLDDDEKAVALTDTLGGKQEMNIISESGMYTLILRCRDAVKKGSVPHRFRKWVTSEVLPQIRKTGQYIKPTRSQEKTFTHTLKNSEAVDLAWLWFEATKMVDFIRTVTPALELLGSNLVPSAHSLSAEYGRHLNEMGKMIYRLTADADFSFNPTPLKALSAAVGGKSTSLRKI